MTDAGGLKYKNLYRECKKELRAAEKKLRSKNDELLRERSEVDLKNQEISGLKEKLYTISEMNSDIKANYDSLKKEKDDMEKHLNEVILNLQMQLNEANQGLENREYFDKRFEDIKKDNKNFQRKINRLKQQNTKKDEKISKLKKELDVLDMKLYEQRQEIEAYTNIDPDFILHTLIELLSPENYKQYSLANDLSRKLRRVEKGLRIVSKVQQNKNDGVGTELYGNLYKKFDDFLFVDLEGNKYTIAGKPNYKGYTNGIPVSAYMVENGEVIISYVYRKYLKEFSMEAEILLNTKTKGKKDKKDGDQFEPIGDFSVLVVSSRNGVKYRDRLKLHGIKADAVDGFEIKARTLELMDKADVVILCVDSMTQTFHDYAKQQNDPKYQYIYKANEEKVVARVIYVKHHLGI
ncbi:hypothetical protein [Bacillus amyloliquefaciens]|uniref:hypothetical protein n=1 Tax=Bacillus amyloliquefaciens TaxID=1390 RepID=UPI00073B37E5|nr:hypothetical protein [Bacillus amyloliquefaciens]KTF59872.1 hypothetical protein AR691_14175 [Bacillus amyloliquefaciens]